MAPYHTIRGLENVYLEDSFVLSVTATPGIVEFQVEVVLMEAHPRYSEPLPGEQYCYRNARLRFVGVQGLRWQMGGIHASRDATNEADYGGFDNFETTEHGFSLEGDFGALTIDSGECQIVFDN